MGGETNSKGGKAKNWDKRDDKVDIDGGLEVTK